MTQDFELLKKDTEVIYDGIRTQITGCGVIVKLLSNYMKDVWGYLTEKYPEEDFSEHEAWYYDPRFQYIIGNEYIVLNLDEMSEDDIDWDCDYVLIDNSKIPSYTQRLDKLVELSDIDVPRDVRELTDEQLEELHGMVRLGSIYLADFNNPFFVDREELSDYCEEYEYWLEKEGIADSPEMFCYYMKEVA